MTTKRSKNERKKFRPEEDFLFEIETKARFDIPPLLLLE